MQVRFRVSQPLDRNVQTEPPDVASVEITEDRWLITGSGQLLSSAAGALARAQVVALTGRAPDSPGASERKAD